MTTFARRVRVLDLRCAWMPFAGLYASLDDDDENIARPRRGSSVGRASTYVAPMALFGVGIWWFTGVARRGRRASAVAIRRRAPRRGGGVRRSRGWRSKSSIIAWRPASSGAWAAAQAFAGFQVLDGLIRVRRRSPPARTRFASRGGCAKQEARAARADALRMRAELAALRGQLNPHFLFNTLHTLTALVRRDPETAEHALERFGDMLRYVLDVKRVGARGRHAGRRAAVRARLSVARAAPTRRSLNVGRADRSRCARLRDSVAHAAAAGRERDQVRHCAARAGRCASRSPRRSTTTRSCSRCATTDRARTSTTSTSAAGHGSPRGAAAPRDALRQGRRVSVTTAPGEGFIVRAAIPAHVGTVLPRCLPARTAAERTTIPHEDAHRHRRGRADRARRSCATLLSEVDWIRLRRRSGRRADRGRRRSNRLKPRSRLPRHRDAGARRTRRPARASRHDPAVVFTTAYDKFAVAAFELEAIDYLLKPFGRDRLYAALDRVKRAVAATATFRSRTARTKRSSSAAAGSRESSCATAGDSADRRRRTSSASRPTTTTSPCTCRGRRYLVYLGMNEFEARLDPRPIPADPPLAHREPRPRRVAHAGRGHALRDRDARRLEDPRQPHALARAARPGDLIG